MRSHIIPATLFAIVALTCFTTCVAIPVDALVPIANRGLDHLDADTRTESLSNPQPSSSFWLDSTLNPWAHSRVGPISKRSTPSSPSTSPKLSVKARLANSRVGQIATTAKNKLLQSNLGKTVTGTASAARKQAETSKTMLPELVEDRKTLAQSMVDNNDELGEALKDKDFLREDMSMPNDKWLEEIKLNAGILEDLREHARTLATARDDHQSVVQDRLKAAGNAKLGLTTRPKDVQLRKDLDGVIQSTVDGTAEKIPEILGLEGT